MTAICDWIDKFPITNSEILIIIGFLLIVILFPGRRKL